jgi:hypothetical protein
MQPYTFGRTTRGDLQASTIITLDATMRREIHLTTEKHCNGGLSCVATVYRITEDGRGRTHAFSFCKGQGDFRRTLKYAPKTRATEKAIRAMHEACIAELPAVCEQARAFYAAQVVEA